MARGTVKHVTDIQRELRALLSVNKYGNGAISTWDKNELSFSNFEVR